MSVRKERIPVRGLKLMTLWGGASERRVRKERIPVRGLKTMVCVQDLLSSWARKERIPVRGLRLVVDVALVGLARTSEKNESAREGIETVRLTWAWGAG